MSRRTRGRHRGPTPPKSRPAEQRAKREIAEVLDPLAPDARERVLAGALREPLLPPNERSRTEPDVRELLMLSEAEGVGGSTFNHLDPEGGEFLAVIGRNTADTIYRTLMAISGPRPAQIPVTQEQVLAALADWRRAVEAERDHMGDQIDKLDVIREMRLRQSMLLNSRLMDVELGTAFLPRSGNEVHVISGRLRAVAMREPGLLVAAQAVRTYFGHDIAKQLFDEALAAEPEWGAFEPQYVDALRRAIVRHHPKAAHDAGLDIPEPE